MDVNPYELIKIWHIGLGSDTKMLKATTQRVLRSDIISILRQYRAGCMFERTLIKGMIFIDTTEGQYKSLGNNRYSQVFANYYFFADAYLMDNKSLAGQGLREFITDFGVMERLVWYGYKDQTSKGKDSMK